MARKSKRLVLNDAIRQGQARIQEGLKNGTLRSDRETYQSEIEGKQGAVRPEKPSPFKQKNITFTSKYRTRLAGVWLSRPKVLMYAASVVGLAVVLWIIMGVFNKNPSSEIQNPVSANAGNTPRGEVEKPVNRITDDNRVILGQGSNNTPPKEVANEEINTPIQAVTSTGDNVIWIVSISLDRKNELLPVEKFFRSKGIETEIITADGKGVLVTKAGFENNPSSRGTQGYSLYQQIKQLGSVYIQETEDTKFGQTPFQDVYGYKRK